MHEAYGSDAPSDRTQEQAVAMCHQAWRDKHGGEKPKGARHRAEVNRIIALWRERVGENPSPKTLERLVGKQDSDVSPEEGESEDDFIDRCLDELTSGDDPISYDEAQDVCSQEWTNYAQERPGFGEESGDKGLKKKRTKAGEVTGLDTDSCPDIEEGESKDDYNDRCIDALVSDFSIEEDELDDILPELTDVCNTAYEEQKSGDKGLNAKKRTTKQDEPEPEEGESYSDFLQRCMEELGGDEGEDEVTCDGIYWEAHPEEMSGDRDLARKEAGMKRRRERQVASIIATFKKKFGDNPAKLVALTKIAGEVPDPEMGEDMEDYVDRCIDAVSSDDVDEDDAEDACRSAWESMAGDKETYGGEEESGDKGLKRKKPTGVVHKTHAGVVQGMEFILSDETPDRMDDVIMSAGWQFDNFAKNPVALFNHRSDFLVGKWHNLRIDPDTKSLRGHLELAPKGTSERIDEIRNLIDADILRAVSVGFKPMEARARPDSDKGGFLYTKSELVEVSLVSIPANPNALAVAKSLNVSEETQKVVFGKSADKKTSDAASSSTASSRGEHADKRKARTSPASMPKLRAARGGHSMLLSKRIEEAERYVVQLQDKLRAHLDSVDDQNPDDTSMAITEELTQKIKAAERNRDNLKAAEQRLVKTSGNGGGKESDDDDGKDHRKPLGYGPRPYGLPAKKVSPIEYLIRQGIIQMIAHKERKPLDVVRRELYGDDESTKLFLDYTIKASTAPAMTTVTGWAAELVSQIYADFMEALVPSSVMPKLASMGLSLTFGRAGRVIIPTRSLTPSLAGSFVGEGQPIPVRQGAFSSQTLVPKKMAVITTWTREMDEHSTPAVEGLLRDAVQQDTATALDYVLLDNNPATAIRPPGLRNGVTGQTPTAGGGFTALVGDIKNLTGALLTATQGHIRKMVLLMNPQQVLSISLIQPPNAATGLFPFSEEIQAGKLRTATVIESGNVPIGMVIALDAADFVAVGSEAPRFEVSDQATLHMEDTAPADITGGTPSPAVPVKSMWQTDSLALRLIWPMNWALRRPNMVSWVQGVTW